MSPKRPRRWIRPLVPGFVARAIDTSTHPLRSARQVIEEFEEITFTLKRTRKLTVDTEESAGLGPSRRSAAMNPGKMSRRMSARTPCSADDAVPSPIYTAGNDVALAPSRRETRVS